MKNITFAERLKEARKSAKLSQEALAKSIGRTKSTISRWESGERNPKMFEMIELEKILGVSAEKLLYGTEEIKETTLSEINRISAKLEEPRKQVVLETAKEQHKQQEKEKIVPLEDYRLSDEYLEEQINEAVAFDGKPLSDNDKEFFKQLLKKTLKKKIERGE